MKKGMNLTFVFLMIFALTNCKKTVYHSDVNSSDVLLSLMPSPPAEYRAAPLWDWNDKITEGEIDYHMKKFKEGGIGGVFVHPRPGLVTDYLSDDWSRLFKYTVDVATELGMEVWIYDENSYPSGFAGGHVPARYPDSYKHGTGLGLKLVTDLNEITNLPVEVLFRKAEEPQSTDTATNYYVFYRTYSQTSWWYGGFPYVDLLYPSVTDTFMKVTMEAYEKYSKEDFGKTLRGVFTDEPNLEAAKGPGTLIRWTPLLFDHFEDRWGYRLEPELPSLMEETGNWTQVRHDYYTLVLEMFLDYWAIPWHEYCQENDLIWTGHYWEHGWPYPGDGIDESAFYMYHQMPGIDMLGRTYDPRGLDQQWGNTRAVRELGSAANQAGWNRRLSETWGGAGWQISFKELKRLVDWQVALGVNFINPHLSYYSMLGVRKFDYPPSFSYQEPWWDNFSLLGDYIGRICLAMSAGEQINHQLVLQPNTTAWMFHTPGRGDERINAMSVAVKTFIQTLESEQVEYDLGSEQVMRRFGMNTKDGIKIQNRVYERFIIPPGTRNLDISTLNLLKEFLSDGFPVICYSDSIDYVDGYPNDAVQQLVAQYPISWIKGRNVRADARNLLSSPDVVIRQMNDSLGQVFHQRRVLEDGQLLFLVNSDLESPASVQIEIKGRDVVEIDLLNGEPRRITHTRKGLLVVLSPEIPEGGSRLFLISGSKIRKVSGAVSHRNNDSDIAFDSPIKANRIEPNVLTIDYLDLETRNARKTDIYFMNAMYSLFQESGLKTGNPWQHKIQYRQQYVEMDQFTPDSWFRAQYHFDIDSTLTARQLGSIEAVIERPGIWRVYLNGKEIKPAGDRWWLDRQFPVFEIGNLVKPGGNTIELRASKMSVFAELMPIYILGDFGLVSTGRGFKITGPQTLSTGSWKDQGLPFYGNKVGYSADIAIDELEGQYFVKAESWRGSVAEVWVNGTKAGIIGWDPMELDITSHLGKGKNSVELMITGSLKNTLGYHHIAQTGWIDGPWSWNQAPEKQPPGEAYEFLDYGLMEGFQVVRRN